MAIDIEGIFLRSDFTEFISEKFARRYGVSLKDGWIQPFGYYSQAYGSTICNEAIPDGTYIVCGKVDYPGTKRMSRHIVLQFNLCKSMGADLRFAKQFDPYPDKPEAIPLTPSFPMFKVGNHLAFNTFKQRFLEIADELLTIDEVKDKLSKLDFESIEYKVYGIKLALLREMYKEN